MADNKQREKLLEEKKLLEAKLVTINNEIKSFDENIKNKRLERIEAIDKLKPAGKQLCTCSIGLPVDDENFDIIKCYKHLSRYFQNQGCYWCYDTDCSKHGC